MAHNRTLWLFVVGFKIIRNEPPHIYKPLHPQAKRMDKDISGAVSKPTKRKFALYVICVRNSSSYTYIYENFDSVFSVKVLVCLSNTYKEHDC